MSADSELIVCASDFSEQSASALEWAVAFARREGLRIDLVHVVPEPTRNPALLATDAATFEAAGFHDARERLALAATAAVRAGVTVQPHVLAGQPELRIVEHARLHGARAIVVGATGRPVLERWVLGSVAERTIRTATCPVIVVPRHPAGRSWHAARGGASAPALQALVGLEGADEGGLEYWVGRLDGGTPRDRPDPVAGRKDSMISATLSISRSAPVTPIRRDIYGYFLEHFHRIIYGGIFEPGSLLSDERGFRMDVAEAPRELGVGDL